MNDIYETKRVFQLLKKSKTIKHPIDLLLPNILFGRLSSNSVNRVLLKKSGNGVIVMRN